MKTLLLIAGRSRRFWPLKEKSFFPICGTTLLEYQVGQLRAGGYREIVLVGGDHNLKEARRLFPKMKCIRQKDLDLGMRGALLSALPSCKKESVMVVGANDVIESDAYQLLHTAAVKPGVAGAFLGKVVEKYFPGGYLTVKGQRAISIVEKPGEGNEPGNLVNIVAHIHNDASILLKELKNVHTKNDDGYERALAALMKTHDYRIVRYSGLWQAVKYPWHLLHLLSIFLGKISPSIHKKAVVHSSAVIEGAVTLEEGVRVLSHATIIGPTHIGKGSIVGTGTLIRGSSIGKNCVIGFGTEVKSSVLAHDVWTHMAYVGDSVIGNNVAFASGSITGNLRLDEKEIPSMVNGERINTGLRKFGNIVGGNCRIGINVSLNPGIKIGDSVFIGSGAIISKDIGDGMFVKVEGAASLSLRKNRTGTLLPVGREEFRRAAKI